MSVYRAVWLLCDACEVENPETAAVFGMDDAYESVAGVRAAAKEAGWAYTRGLDVCPEHRDGDRR